MTTTILCFLGAILGIGGQTTLETIIYNLGIINWERGNRLRDHRWVPDSRALAARARVPRRLRRASETGQ